MNKLSYFLDPSNWFFPPSRRYRLEVKATELEISKIKDFAQAICSVGGYSLADSNVIKLVLEEVCVNIIHHAYPGDIKGSIQVEMSIGYFGMRIRVTDQGEHFDFHSVKDPDLEHYVQVAKKGGLGLWVIRKMMTKVRYHAHVDHNEWILFYRPNRNGTEVEMDEKPRVWDGLSVKFVMASFVLFTFLLFLVYVLSVILAQDPGMGVTVPEKMAAGLKTNLGKGIFLIYGMGLVGFALIFLRLFQPLLKDRPRLGWAERWKLRHDVQRDRSDYERLLTMMTEMEQKAQETQEKLLDQEVRQAQLQELEKQFQEAQQKIRDYEGKSAESARGSREREELEGQLKDMKTRLETQAHVQEGMRKEVQVAQQIQHALLPKEYPQIEGFQVGSSYRAASEVGGDYYDFIWVDPTTLGIAVGDVAGKGVPGSMVMAMIRTAMRLEAQKHKSPSKVLLNVHQHVNGDMKRGMFATMFYIVLDSRKRSISYASAGHNPMLLYRRTTDEVYFLKPKGFPLGIDLPDESLFAKTLALQKLSLQKDDLLLIYTDGVTEAMNAEREQFGEERMIQSIRDHAHRPAGEVVQKLEEDLSRFVGGADQSDDVTIVVIKENMQAEDVIYKFRKNLLNLVEVEGLSIAEACRRAHVSPQTYYYYKAIYDKKGDAGLKPPKARRKAVVHELSLDQRNAVLGVVKSNPELNPSQIVEFLKRFRRPAIHLETKVVSEFLNRKGLGEAKERKVYAANEIDTV